MPPSLGGLASLPPPGSPRLLVGNGLEQRTRHCIGSRRMKTSSTLSMRTSRWSPIRSDGPAGRREMGSPQVLLGMSSTGRSLVEHLEAELAQVGGQLLDGFLLPALQLPGRRGLAAKQASVAGYVRAVDGGAVEVTPDPLVHPCPLEVGVVVSWTRLPGRGARPGLRSWRRRLGRGRPLVPGRVDLVGHDRPSPPRT